MSTSTLIDPSKLRGMTFEKKKKTKAMFGKDKKLVYSL